MRRVPNKIRAPLRRSDTVPSPLEPKNRPAGARIVGRCVHVAFLLISTDKAVRPTSVMGVTKRIAEQVVQQAPVAEKRNFVSVRFGNVLDMGEPIRIVDLAKDLIRLSGLEEGTDIEIEYTGVRPGEKLYEEVFFGHEDVRSTHHPKVLRTISTEPDAGFADAVDALIRQVTIRPVDEGAVRDKLREMVPDFAREDARGSSKPTPYPTARDKGQTG